MSIKKGFTTIASSVPTTEWGNIEGTITDQEDLKNALGDKAPLYSPSFTGIPTAPTVAIGTVTNQIATTKFVDNAIAAAGTGLPSQEGHAGQYLKTDGTSASWTTVDALPSQSGQSGKYLTTNGTTASWATLSMDSKLDKVTTSGSVRVYGITTTGTQNTYTVSSSAATADTIVMRATSGTIVTGTPTADSHATTKLYVDNMNSTTETNVKNYVISRSSNLVTNGYGTLGTNYNFTGFTFSDNTFVTTVVNTEKTIDEYIVIDKTQTYNLTYSIMSTDASAKYQAFIEFYDKDKTRISVGTSALTHLVIGDEYALTVGTLTNKSATLSYSDIPSTTYYVKIGWIVGKNVSTVTTTLCNVSFTNYGSLVSPNFSGTPTAPTATAGTNNTQIATTAFVKTAVDDVTLAGSTFITVSNKTISYTGKQPYRLGTRSWTLSQWKQYCERGVTTNIAPSYDVTGLKAGDYVTVEGLVTDKSNISALAWGIVQSYTSGGSASVLFIGLSFQDIDLPRSTITYWEDDE